MRVRLRQALTHDVRVGLALVATSLFFHLPAWAAGLIPMEDDVRVFYFPLLVATSTALSQGTIPLWTPSVFGGYPLFADGEGGMLYPIHLLLLPWLTPEASLVALRIVHSALASIFTYQFLRTLGVGRIGSLVAGLIYAYSGFAAGQIVHSNVFHSMTWLPLELTLAERACQANGGARYRYAVLVGAVFGIQGLAAHVHVTLMSAVMVGLFVAYRGLTSGSGIKSFMRGGLGTIAMVAIVGLVGGALSAVQLIPLFELGMQSYRGGGLDRVLAAANSVWPGGLLTLLLPGLFDTVRGGFWGPWVKWETVLYVGIFPLALAQLGLFARAGLYRPFFGGIAVLALILTLGPDAPVPLWTVLRDVPGFGVLQSPGRFSLLFTMAVAVLAGYGVEWLQRARSRPRVAARVMIVGVAAAVLVALALEELSSLVRDWAGSGGSLLDDYLRRAGMPSEVDGAVLTAASVAELAANALTISNPATAWQIGLLVVVAPVAALWLLGARARLLASVATPALIVLDLSMLWLSYHPYGQIATLRPVIPPPLLQSQTEPYRVFTPPTTADKLTQLEPNRLLIARLQEAGGYSSIEPSRHIAYAEAVQDVGNYLLDLWNVRFLVRRAPRALLPSYALTSFVPSQPLFTGRRGNPGSGGVLLPDGGDARADAVHVIASLWDADLLADGATVARVVLESSDGVTQTLLLRAGYHVSDARTDIPGRARTAHHGTAEVAFQYQRTDPAASRFGEQIYHAHLPLEVGMLVRRVTIDMVAPVGGLEVYGVGLFNAQTGEVTQVRDKANLRPVYRDAQLTILQNAAVMPRAFLVERAVVAPVDRDVLSWMIDSTFDPREVVFLEAPNDGSVAPGSRSMTAAPTPSQVGTEAAPSRSAPLPIAPDVAITSYQDEVVTVQVTSARDAYLVLTDPEFPGWVARVDGQPRPILAADYLFRAIAVPGGTHTVTFTFEPLSIARGAAMSALALVVVLLVAGGHLVTELRRRRRALSFRRTFQDTTSQTASGQTAANQTARAEPAARPPAMSHPTARQNRARRRRARR